MRLIRDDSIDSSANQPCNADLAKIILYPTSASEKKFCSYYSNCSQNIENLNKIKINGPLKIMSTCMLTIICKV